MVRIEYTHAALPAVERRNECEPEEGQAQETQIDTATFLRERSSEDRLLARDQDLDERQENRAARHDDHGRNGADVEIREHATVHGGTAGGLGKTTIGDRSLLMAYSHVAHDCQVGSRIVIDNCGTLAGHVEVADDAVIGAFSAVHQFCRVGPHAFIGGYAVVLKDALPYMRTVGGRPAKCYGPNTIGLERKGLSDDRIEALKAFWRVLRNPKLNTSQALEKVREELAGQEDIDRLLGFIDSSERGVTLARG